jgi:hypothetical protein
MARVHFVKRAAKDYPQAGIKKGESYYWWAHFRMPKQFSKTRPKGSEVAASDYAKGVLMAVEALEEWDVERNGAWSADDRDELVAALEAIRDEEQDKFDNMPEGLQQGDVGVRIEDRVAALEEWIGELEGIDFEEEVEEGGETPLEKALATAADAG